MRYRRVLRVLCGLCLLLCLADMLISGLYNARLQAEFHPVEKKENPSRGQSLSILTIEQLCGTLFPRYERMTDDIICAARGEIVFYDRPAGEEKVRFEKGARYVQPLWEFYAFSLPTHHRGWRLTYAFEPEPQEGVFRPSKLLFAGEGGDGEFVRSDVLLRELKQMLRDGCARRGELGPIEWLWIEWNAQKIMHFSDWILYDGGIFLSPDLFRPILRWRQMIPAGIGILALGALLRTRGERKETRKRAAPRARLRKLAGAGAVVCLVLCAGSVAVPAFHNWYLRVNFRPARLEENPYEREAPTIAEIERTCRALFPKTLLLLPDIVVHPLGEIEFFTRPDANSAVIWRYTEDDKYHLPQREFYGYSLPPGKRGWRLLEPFQPASNLTAFPDGKPNEEDRSSPNYYLPRETLERELTQLEEPGPTTTIPFRYDSLRLVRYLSVAWYSPDKTAYSDWILYENGIYLSPDLLWPSVNDRAGIWAMGGAMLAVIYAILRRFARDDRERRDANE